MATKPLQQIVNKKQNNKPHIPDSKDNLRT